MHNTILRVYDLFLFIFFRHDYFDKVMFLFLSERKSVINHHRQHHLPIGLNGILLRTFHEYFYRQYQLFVLHIRWILSFKCALCLLHRF